MLELNRRAQARMRCESRLAVVPGATHLFEEPGTLEQAAALACDWFVDHLGRLAVEQGSEQREPDRLHAAVAVVRVSAGTDRLPRRRGGD